MIALDAKSVADELRAAESTAALHHTPIRKMVNTYCGGKWWRDDLTIEATPENHVFAYADWLEPQLAYAAPAAIVEANWEKSHGDIAKWMETCQARATACYPITDDFRLWVVDIIFGYGVLKIVNESIDGTPQPTISHVPIDQWGCATGPGIAKLADSPIQYHRYDVDLDDLAMMPDLDPAALERVQNTYDPAGERAGAGVPGTRTGDRKRCRVYDVWFAKERMVGTLLSAGGQDPMAEWLKPPLPWKGPKCGPFVVVGLKRVPGSPYFMSPLMPVMQQIEKLNAHLRADATEADSMKTFWGYDAAAPEVGKAMEEARTGAIVPIPGLRQGLVQKFDVGGVHPARLEHTSRMVERVKLALAMGDVVQGVSNSDTATANDRAFKSANIRVEYARSLINEKAAVALKGVMFYRFYDPAYEERISYTEAPPIQAMTPMVQPQPLPVDPTAAGAGPNDPMGGAGGGVPQMPQPDPATMPPGMPAQPGPQRVEAYYRGGTGGGFYRGEWFPPQVDLDWERDFTVTVDANSTSHTSDQAKLEQSLQLLDVQERGWNMLMTMPGADVEYSIDRIGEAMNIRTLFKKLFTAQMVAMAQAGNPWQPVALPQGASPAMGPGLAGMNRVNPPALTRGSGPGLSSPAGRTGSGNQSTGSPGGGGAPPRSAPARSSPPAVAGAA